MTGKPAASSTSDECEPTPPVSGDSMLSSSPAPFASVQCSPVRVPFVCSP